MQSNRLVEKLRDELRVVKAELAERTRLGKRYEISYANENLTDWFILGAVITLSWNYLKCTRSLFVIPETPQLKILWKCFFQSAEQQRNQALRNAEKLTVTFKEYKEDVSEKLRTVIWLLKLIHTVGIILCSEILLLFLLYVSYMSCIVEGVGEWRPAEGQSDGVWQRTRGAGEEVCWAGERKGESTSQLLVREHFISWSVLLWAMKIIHRW